MKSFKFGSSSTKKLETVNIKLQHITRLALYLSPVDFSVIWGIRTKAEQQVLFDKGYSKTMNSYHLTGNAIDLAPYVDGKIIWDVVDRFKEIYVAVFVAAKILNVKGLEWGGAWTWKDYAHYQLRNGGF
jgi:peptidoglycan L-alanyl-D-glutamate endopeptidase CwlK